MATIPKKIHYCWFGGNPLTPIAEKCIESWKEHCPDYEIIEWNETNIDIDSSPFMRAAYDNKKWAFVSDYARYKVIYENGGIYLDVDVEVIKSLDDLLKYGAYMGFEGSEYVNSGLGFGAMAGDKMLKQTLDVYDGINFEEHKDNPAEISAPIVTTNILLEHGFKKGGELQKVGTITILPEDYLCPKNPITRLTNITQNSHSIHHFDASWVDEKERRHIDKLEEAGKDDAMRFPDLISIIIPVYNGEDYLAIAIESALQQTYKNIEVIVVDDGSSDRTEEIARSFGARIRYIRKQNGGVSSALNLGLKSMRGKYFAWLSHDDVYHKEKLEVLHNEISGLDRVIAISDWDIIDENGIFLRRAKLDDRLSTTPKSFLAFDRNTWLNACAMLIPKSLFDEVGFFDETLRTTQDYDMHFRMMEHGASFKVVHRQLFYSRAHANQGSLVISDDTFSNSDNMHASIIAKLTKDDFEDYFRSNPAEFEKTYRSFVSNGYSLTPVEMVRKALELYGKKSAFARRIISRSLVSMSDTVSDEGVNRALKVLSTSKKRPRVLICSGRWLTGGMERVISNLFSYLDDKYDIILITPGNYEESETTIPIPKSVTHIKITEDLYRDSFDMTAFTYAKLLGVDIVTGFLNLNDGQLNLYERCVKNGIKTVASNHEYYFFPYRSPDSDMRRLALRRKEVYKKLDAVLWLTNFSTAVYNIDAHNGYLMPNPNTFDVQKLSAKNATKNIICVGRFNDHVKRVDRIIDVFSRVQKIVPGATLTLVGAIDRDMPTADSRGSSIDDLILEKGITSGSIIFAGETKDTSRYYANADLILMTSETEGFPMVLTEAMCHGLPVVCGDIPGLEDIVIDGYNGLIAERDNTAAIAQGVVEILTDNSLRDTMGQNAQAHVKRYEGELIADKWDYLFRTIIKGRNLSTRLREKLSFEVGDKDIFEERIINELDESTKQSLVMARALSGDSRESSRAKVLRLARSTRRDYATMGVRRASKKALKKVTRKVANVLGLDKHRQ